MLAFLSIFLEQISPQTFDFGVIVAVIVLFSAAGCVINAK